MPPRVGDKAVTARQECCAPREPLRHEARGTRHEARGTRHEARPCTPDAGVAHEASTG